MIETPPRIILLAAAKATLGAIDWLTASGVTNVKVRHQRFRRSTSGEVPCMSIVFVQDDTRGDDLDRNAWETVRLMQIELHATVNLATEISGDDDTGLLQMSRMVAAAIQALRDPASPMMQVCDWVTINGAGPDDNSSADHARLEQALTVVYRVRSDDENVLLANGATG